MGNRDLGTEPNRRFIRIQGGSSCPAAPDCFLVACQPTADAPLGFLTEAWIFL